MFRFKIIGFVVGALSLSVVALAHAGTSALRPNRGVVQRDLSVTTRGPRTLSGSFTDPASGEILRFVMKRGRRLTPHQGRCSNDPALLCTTGTECTSGVCNLERKYDIGMCVMDEQGRPLVVGNGAVVPIPGCDAETQERTSEAARAAGLALPSLNYSVVASAAVVLPTLQFKKPYRWGQKAFLDFFQGAEMASTMALPAGVPTGGAAKGHSAAALAAHGRSSANSLAEVSGVFVEVLPPGQDLGSHLGASSSATDARLASVSAVGFRHYFEVRAGTIRGIPGEVYHSATWGYTIDPAGKWEWRTYSCNHGRCPWEMGFWCFALSYPNRSSHVHNAPCEIWRGVYYNPFSTARGHNCNDDSTNELWSMELNYHFYGNYPCWDPYTNYYPPRC